MRVAHAQAEGAVAAGMMPWQLWFDPGIGFAKTSSDSLNLIRRLPVVRFRYIIDSQYCYIVSRCVT
eukprot:226038-Prorocentrum_minimum.AAC.10